MVSTLNNFLRLKPNLETGISWNNYIFFYLCEVIKDVDKELYKFDIDYITNGADIYRDSTPPPTVQVPYVIKIKYKGTRF